MANCPPFVVYVLTHNFIILHKFSIIKEEADETSYSFVINEKKIVFGQKYYFWFL